MTSSPWTLGKRPLKIRNLRSKWQTSWINGRQWNQKVFWSLTEPLFWTSSILRWSDIFCGSSNWVDWFCLKNTFMNINNLVTDSEAYQKKSPINGLVDVSIPWMIESGQKHFYLDLRLGNLGYSTMFMDSAIRRFMTQLIFIPPVA